MSRRPLGPGEPSSTIGCGCGLSLRPLPLLTCSRITLRKDTSCILAISLNMTEQVNPIIWHIHTLPFDLCYALPVPTPIG